MVLKTMLLNPKRTAVMELTEEMARNLLVRYCRHEKCDDECLFANDKLCAIAEVLLDDLRDDNRRRGLCGSA